MKGIAFGLTLILTAAMGSLALADDKPRNVQAVPGIWYVLSGHNDSVSYGGTTVWGHDQNVGHKVCFRPCGSHVVDPFAAPNPGPYVIASASATTTTATTASTAPAAAPAAARAATAPVAAPKAATAPAKPKTLPSTSTFPSDPGEPIN